MNPFERLLLKYSRQPTNLSYKENGKDMPLELSKLNIELGKGATRSQLDSYSFAVKEPESSILVTYRSEADPFMPEKEKYFEPDWKQYQSAELLKAIEYISTRIDFDILPKRQDIGLLVFKDKFYLSVRIPTKYNRNKEHCLCFSVQGHSLSL